MGGEGGGGAGLGIEGLGLRGSDLKAGLPTVVSVPFSRTQRGIPNREPTHYMVGNPRP